MDRLPSGLDKFYTMRTDTTNPAVLAAVRHLASPQANRQVIEAANRLRIIPVGFYHGQVGPEWGSGGRLECDQLHHAAFSLAGGARIRHRQRDFDLRPGTCCWLPGNTPVSRYSPASYESYYLTFRCEWIPGIDLLTDWSGRRPLDLGDWDCAAWVPAWERTPLEAGTLIAMTALLTARLVRCLPDLDSIIATHHRANAAFPEVFAHLAAAGETRPTVADLARVHGTSPATFAQAFTRAMGISPKQFLNRRIHQDACTLLRDTSLPIKAIAARLGFSDPFYFSRWFTNANGQPPGRFRSRNA